MTERLNVGLDFGTTNCTIARMHGNGRISVVGPEPSVGVWRNGQFSFGHQGKDLIFSGKEDVYPVRDLKLRLTDCDAQIRVGPVSVSAVEAASELMRHVFNSSFRGQEKGNVVIGTPVRMYRQHRLALREAARLAGFESVRLIYEPTAALIGAMDPDRIDSRSLNLVVDWGGGTLDVAVVRVDGGLVREFSVDGDISELGGTRIDEAIARALLGEYPEIAQQIVSDDGDLEVLKEIVEEQKISILEDPGGIDAEDRHIIPPHFGGHMYLRASLVYDVVADFAARARNQIAAVLEAARIDPYDITHVLFAGGTCQAPLTRDLIARDFPQARRIDTSNPQLLTGRGCAKLIGRDFQVELAADLAVREADDRLCVLLPRGQAVQLNTYRTCEFEVTDVDAPEAIFDLGVCHFDPSAHSMAAADASSFRSMQYIFVPTERAFTPHGAGAPDRIKLYVGVDENLTVAVYAQSNRGNSEAQEFLSGAPLAVRFRGGG